MQATSHPGRGGNNSTYVRHDNVFMSPCLQNSDKNTRKTNETTWELQELDQPNYIHPLREKTKMKTPNFYSTLPVSGVYSSCEVPNLWIHPNLVALWLNQRILVRLWIPFEFRRHLTTSRHPTKPPWKGWHRHLNLTFSHTKRTGNLGYFGHNGCTYFQMVPWSQSAPHWFERSQPRGSHQRVSQILVDMANTIKYLRPIIMVQWKRGAYSNRIVTFQMYTNVVSIFHWIMTMILEKEYSERWSLNTCHPPRRLQKKIMIQPLEWLLLLYGNHGCFVSQRMYSTLVDGTSTI